MADFGFNIEKFEKGFEIIGKNYESLKYNDDNKNQFAKLIKEGGIDFDSDSWYVCCLDGDDEKKQIWSMFSERDKAMIKF